MESLKKVLKDRNTNNLVVGFILAFATVTFVQDVVDIWNSEASYWVGQLTRDVIAYIILLAVATYLARIAK
jgi:uncharacterized membrane protein